MPAVTGLVPCTTGAPNSTLADAGDELAKDDRNALLYIVVTLLFYSMGIIVGIITYLKRERREMLEDKLFDVYFQMKSDPYTAFKSKRVQLVAARLAALDQEKHERETKLSETAGCSQICKDIPYEKNPLDSELRPNNSSEDSTNFTSSLPVSRPTSIHIEKSSTVSDDVFYSEQNETHCDITQDNFKDDVNTQVDENAPNLKCGLRPSGSTTDPLSKSAVTFRDCLTADDSSNIAKSTPNIHDSQRKNVFQVSPSGEPISAAVAKIFESERRGGLLMSPKALHLFDRDCGKRRLGNRQLSMDVPDTPGRERLINRQLSMDVPSRMMSRLSVDPPRRGRLRERQLSMDVPDRDLVANIEQEVEDDKLLVENEAKSDEESTDCSVPNT